MENLTNSKRLKDIYKWHSCLCTRFYFQRPNHIPDDYTVGIDGKIYVVGNNYVLEKFKHDINNIISISGSCGCKIFLTNDGFVYVYNLSELFMICESNEQPLSNIVQIVQSNRSSFFLSSDGNVYKTIINTTHAKLILKDIIRIIINEYDMILFLTKDGNIFKINDEDKISKIEAFNNVMNAVLSGNNLFLTDKDFVTKTYRKTVNNYEYINTLPKNIIKIKTERYTIGALTYENELYIAANFPPHNFILRYTNIKDFSLSYRHILTLSCDNKLMLHDHDGNNSKIFDVSGNIHLVENDFGCIINGIAYYIDGGNNITKLL